jgi:hypothetical protein
MRQQLARVPCVLAEDEIRGLQRRHGARGHVREIPERGADDEKFAHGSIVVDLVDEVD